MVCFVALAPFLVVGGVITAVLATGGVAVGRNANLLENFFKLVSHQPVAEWSGEQADVPKPPPGHIWVHRRSTTTYLLYRVGLVKVSVASASDRLPAALPTDLRRRQDAQEKVTDADAAPTPRQGWTNPFLAMRLEDELLQEHKEGKAENLIEGAPLHERMADDGC